MPFTFAHPVIVLPLAKASGRCFSVMALIIGSIVPDFEYFIRMKVFSDHSHTTTGLFYFDLPVGLLMYFISVQLVRTPFILHLPPYLRERFHYSFREKNLVIVTASIFIGALSHLFWDSFTHESGYVVQHVNVLRRKLTLANISVPAFKLLQHASTIIGLFIIFRAIIQLPRNNYLSSGSFGAYWSIVAGIFLLVIFGKYVTGDFTGFGEVVVTAITAGLSGILISSIIYHVRFPDRRAI